MVRSDSAEQSPPHSHRSIGRNLARFLNWKHSVGTGLQASQGNRDESADSGLGRQAGGSCERVQAVARELISRDIASDDAVLGPLDHEVADHLAEPPQLRLVPRVSSTTILVAARAPRLRAAVRGMLDGARFTFAEAGSEEKTLAAARDTRPDLLVLDWGLAAEPVRLCRELRAEAGPAGQKILVLAMRSAAPDSQVRAAASVDGLVMWPSSALQLQLTIAEVLGGDTVEPIA